MFREKVVEGLKGDMGWLDEFMESPSEKMAREDLKESVQEVCMKRSGELIESEEEVQSLMSSLFFEGTEFVNKLSYNSCEQLSREEPFRSWFENNELNPFKNVLDESWKIFVQKLNERVEEHCPRSVDSSFQSVKSYFIKPFCVSVQIVPASYAAGDEFYRSRAGMHLTPERKKQLIKSLIQKAKNEL